MCRMLAIVSKETINESYLKDFHSLAASGKVLENDSESHEDGWGIAGYLGNWTVHFGRSAKGATEDKTRYMNASHKAVRSGSRMLLAHLRKASEGEVSISNAHPFIEREWVFCHNGTVYDADKLALDGIIYEGTTDSEKLFKYITNRLSFKSRGELSLALENIIRQIKGSFKSTSLTFILSNGDYIFGFRDFSEDEYYYTMYYQKKESQFLFCSEPLGGGKWTGMRNGQLIIADKFGEVVFDKIIDTSALTERPKPGYQDAMGALGGV